MREIEDETADMPKFSTGDRPARTLAYLADGRIRERPAIPMARPDSNRPDDVPGLGTDAKRARMARPGLEPSGRCPRCGHGCQAGADGETRTRIVRTMSPDWARMPSGRGWRDPDSNRPDDVPGWGMDAKPARMARPGLESSGRCPRLGHGCQAGADGETRTRTGDTTIFSRVLMRLKHAHMQEERAQRECSQGTEWCLVH